jgi:hypothetical protein
MRFVALTFAFALGVALTAHAETPAARSGVAVNSATFTSATQAKAVKAADSQTKVKKKKKKKKKTPPAHHA